jgi:diaminopimelate decarboxylase
VHSFHYQEEQLMCERVALDTITEAVGTPAYVYSADTIRQHFQRLDAAMAGVDHMICYAMKANSSLAILDLLRSLGAGFDIVSGGELFRVLKAGGAAGKCTFAGVGKTRDEIAFALKEGVYSFNVESEPELEFINAVAGELGHIAPIAIRVNPDVEANTHKYISTGKSQNKFGIGIDRALDVYARAATLPNIKIRGIQTHIGSQILDAKPFAEAVAKLVPIVETLKSLYGIEFFSIGGGIGIVYDPALESGDQGWWTEPKSLTADAYAKLLVPLLKPLGLRILLEPGRFLVGNAGVLVSSVLYVKETPAKTFTIVDAAMNDLIRPALYEGYHEVHPVRRDPDRIGTKMDIVGPVCESGDFFAQDREIPALAAGEKIALMSAGAYGFVMSSNYNSRPLLPEVLVDGDTWHLIRKRQSFDDLIQGESIP